MHVYSVQFSKAFASQQSNILFPRNELNFHLINKNSNHIFGLLHAAIFQSSIFRFSHNLRLEIFKMSQQFKI